MLAKWRYRRMRPDDEGKRAVRAEDGMVIIACNFHPPPPPQLQLGHLRDTHIC